jgi:hypothetical protein
MCFRPSAASMEMKCPKCGTPVGVSDTTCQNCGATEEDFKAAGAGMPGAPGAPGAPGMPKAPGAPGAPKAPGAPGAPKAPGSK